MRLDQLVLGVALVAEELAAFLAGKLHGALLDRRERLRAVDPGLPGSGRLRFGPFSSSRRVIGRARVLESGDAPEFTLIPRKWVIFAANAGKRAP